MFCSYFCLVCGGVGVTGIFPRWMMSHAWGGPLLVFAADGCLVGRTSTIPRPVAWCPLRGHTMRLANYNACCSCTVRAETIFGCVPFTYSSMQLQTVLCQSCFCQGNLGGSAMPLNIVFLRPQIWSRLKPYYESTITSVFTYNWGLFASGSSFFLTVGEP